MSIQETDNSTRHNTYPEETFIILTLQGSEIPPEDIRQSKQSGNSGSLLEIEDWTVLSSYKIKAHYKQQIEERKSFHLNDTSKDQFKSFRLSVGTNSAQIVALRLNIIQQGWLARYEIAMGIAVLCLVYTLIIFELVHRTLAALVGSFWALAVLSFIQQRPSFEEVWPAI